jgi:hypothetical protein
MSDILVLIEKVLILIFDKLSNEPYSNPINSEYLETILKEIMSIFDKHQVLLPHILIDLTDHKIGIFLFILQ